MKKHLNDGDLRAALDGELQVLEGIERALQQIAELENAAGGVEMMHREGQTSGRCRSDVDQSAVRPVHRRDRGEADRRRQLIGVAFLCVVAVVVLYVRAVHTVLGQRIDEKAVSGHPWQRMSSGDAKRYETSAVVLIGALALATVFEARRCWRLRPTPSHRRPGAWDRHRRRRAASYRRQLSCPSAPGRRVRSGGPCKP